MLQQAAAPLRVARGLAARAPTMAAVHQRRAFSDDRDVEVAKTEKQMVAILRRIADAVCIRISRAHLWSTGLRGFRASLCVRSLLLFTSPPPHAATPQTRLRRARAGRSRSRVSGSRCQRTQSAQLSTSGASAPAASVRPCRCMRTQSTHAPTHIRTHKRICTCTQMQGGRRGVPGGPIHLARIPGDPGQEEQGRRVAASAASLLRAPFGVRVAEL